MITSGVIKMNKNVEDADFITDITRKAGKSDTVENSEAIKEEIVELADKIRTSCVREFGGSFYCKISEDEFIDLDKPLLIENENMKAEVTILNNGVNYKITDAFGNKESGAVFFNREALCKNNILVKELESLTKIYIYLISKYNGSDRKAVIEKVELRLKFLTLTCSDYMLNITADDINRIKYFVDKSVVEAVKSLM